MKPATQAKYLGVMLRSDYSNKTDVTTRLAKARMHFKTLHQFWRRTGLSVAWKLRIHNAVFVRVLAWHGAGGFHHSRPPQAGGSHSARSNGSRPLATRKFSQITVEDQDFCLGQTVVVSSLRHRTCGAVQVHMQAKTHVSEHSQCLVEGTIYSRQAVSHTEKSGALVSGRSKLPLPMQLATN